MGSFRIGMMHYPWGILHEGIDTVISNMVDRCGVEASIVCFDHFEETHPNPSGFLPHNPVTKVYCAKGGVFFNPDPKFYKRIIPPKTPGRDFREIDVLKEYVPRAKDAGLKVIGWICALNDPVLVQEYPCASIVDINFTGFHREPTAYCCPNNPDVVDMLVGMVRDIVVNYEVDGIFIDSLGTPSIDLLNLKNPLERLTCFCNYCIDVAERRGIDVRMVRREARELGEEIKARFRGNWEAYIEHRRNPEAILSKYPNLKEWEEAKKDAITRIAVEIMDTLRSLGGSLTLGANVLYPCQRPKEIAKLLDWGKVSGYVKYMANQVLREVESLKEFFPNVEREEIFRTVTEEWTEMGENVLPLMEFTERGFLPEHYGTIVRMYHRRVGREYAIYPGVQLWQVTREEVKEGVASALREGADGVILYSYDWAPLDNFDAVKEAVQECS